MSISRPPERHSQIALTEIHSRAACRRAIPERVVQPVIGKRHVCDEIDFSENQLETARFDVDGDGDRDLIIRISGGPWCGSHGCSTEIYVSQGGRLHWAEPDLVTDGPVMTCEEGRKRGLRFIATGPCFIFKRPKAE